MILKVNESGYPILNRVNNGLLYNWFVGADPRIANGDWRMPTTTDFGTLQTYLGLSGVVGGLLKDIDLFYWLVPNTGASNSSLFNGRGTGQRNSSGSFEQLMSYLYCWTSNQVDGYHSYVMSVNYSSAAIFNNISKFNNSGFSIRLIKNSTTLTNGQSSFYIGNDEKEYRTICIGTQEWLADNLAETKYSNNVIIPEILDNTDWITLTTPGLCAYNNDWINV